MVAEDMNTASFASVSATPSLPNRMASVCAALTTTLTTISAAFAASAGVFAPLPPSFTNRATLSAATSQPVTSNPARRREVAMPKPIDPNPMTAMFGFADEGMHLFPWVSWISQVPLGQWTTALSSGYHGLAALPKHETRPKRVVRQGGRQGSIMSETKVRDDICRLGRSLFERGLTPGSSGN